MQTKRHTGAVKTYLISKTEVRLSTLYPKEERSVFRPFIDNNKIFYKIGLNGSSQTNRHNRTVLIIIPGGNGISQYQTFCVTFQ